MALRSLHEALCKNCSHGFESNCILCHKSYFFFLPIGSKSASTKDVDKDKNDIQLILLFLAHLCCAQGEVIGWVFVYWYWSILFVYFFFLSYCYEKSHSIFHVNHNVFWYCFYRLELNLDLPSAQQSTVGQASASASGEQVIFFIYLTSFELYINRAYLCKLLFLNELSSNLDTTTIGQDLQVDQIKPDWLINKWPCPPRSDHRILQTIAMICDHFKINDWIL